VTSVSPRLDPRLLDAARTLDDPTAPIAETWRRVGSVADELGLCRPSYDSIRMCVRAHRQDRDDVSRLLAPVVADALQGRMSGWDLDRIAKATQVARARDRPLGQDSAAL